MKSNKLSMDFGIFHQTASFSDDDTSRAISYVVKEVKKPLHDEIYAHQIARLGEKIVDFALGMISGELPHIHNCRNTCEFEILEC